MRRRSRGGSVFRRIYSSKTSVGTPLCEMLTEIHIKNFALIDDLTIRLHKGFNVLTGETGAGKSIIIDAITTIVGERLSGDLVRTGAEKAVVEAVFDLSEDEGIARRAAELGYEPEDGLIIISRELSAGGKSQIRVNGRISTLAMLRQLTSGLVDVHGQHEHQSLLDVDNHLEILDEWCGRDAQRLRLEVRGFWESLSEAERELEGLKHDERERERLLDLYRFQKDEIEKAGLKPGEDDELTAERSRLVNSEKLSELAAAAYDALSGGAGDGGAVEMLYSALSKIQAMAGFDESLAALVEDMQNALYAAEQVRSAVRDYRDSIEFSPERLELIEERLDVIRALKRKYGETIENIIQFGRELEDKIEAISRSEERAAAVEARIGDLRKQLETASASLSDVRKAGAVRFAESVERELNELAMEATKFEVSIEPCMCGAKGADRVEFVISPNPGEPMKPLAKIASGGEMSRVMLALKTVMAGAYRVPTLIFDEIDAGIGGRTASVLGRKLAELSKGAQVLCVTHLPQIACFANSHFSVEKSVVDGRTRVAVSEVAGDDRVQEIARMLGEVEDSASAADHARELLEVGARVSGR